TRDVDEFYRLDDSQLAALKDFIASGKPVLACLGPVNRPTSLPGQPPMAPHEPDGLEKLLADLGVRCADETVLFDVEDSDPEDTEEEFQSLGGVKIPPLDFSSSLEALRLRGRTAKKPNPLRQSFRLASRALGKDLSVSLRYLRP